jgi:two-component system, OmpR family, sensor kinase
MSARARLVAAVILATGITLGGAFGAVWVSFNRYQERELDDALVRIAHDEAATLDPVETRLSDLPGPAANDVGPLPKYGAIYTQDGHVIEATASWSAPTGHRARHPDGECFDFWHDGEHLRGVFVPLAKRPEAALLLATSRRDIDGDARMLRNAMGLVLAVAMGWAGFLVAFIVRKFTRHHEIVAEVARKVAAGDLTARVGAHPGDPEIEQVARDIDDMIERLSVLVASQQRFIAHAAHELRSPMTRLYGELQHALARPRDEAEYRRAIEEALDATRRLKTLAEDLLAFARIAIVRGPPGERASVAAFVDSAVSWVATEAKERGIEIHTEIPRDLEIVGVASDLERVVRNLLENAIRYGKRSGSVQIVVRRDEGVVRIQVMDDGPGIRPQDRPRIFDPFFRAARERASDVPGSGLGLAIAREIVRAHGGDLCIDEDHAPGTLLVITLPSAPEAEEAPLAAPVTPTLKGCNLRLSGAFSGYLGACSGESSPPRSASGPWSSWSSGWCSPSGSSPPRRCPSTRCRTSPPSRWTSSPVPEGSRRWRWSGR